MKNTIFLAFSFLLCFGCANKQEDTKEPLPHIFLIYVDDLKPELGAYGNPIIQTPHMDALALDALVFNNAYANVPVCGASRASMLTGVMPNRHRFKDYLGNAEKEVPALTTLPAFLKQHGYRTLSFGKVFHDRADSEHAWSAPPYRGTKQTGKDYIVPETIALAENHPRKRAGFYEKVDTTDEAYLDGRLPLIAQQQLEEHLKTDLPLFMAVGFYKPHLPFNAPTKYWDVYDPAALPYPTNYYVPEDAPAEAIHTFGELRSYTDIPNDDEPLDSTLVRQMVHGYYAATSYADAQIGKFVANLKASGVYDNSLIILVGDHGWFLGEHTMWCKHANFREALRTVLIVKFPKGEKKGMTQLPVGLVELYPTIAEVLGLQAPNHLDAPIFLSLLDSTNEDFSAKEVYCRFENGETLIRGKYAYTEYQNDAGTVTSRMLYDHSQDITENINIVDQVDSTTVSDLSKRLAAHIEAYQ